MASELIFDADNATYPNTMKSFIYRRSSDCMPPRANIEWDFIINPQFEMNHCNALQLTVARS